MKQLLEDKQLLLILTIGLIARLAIATLPGFKIDVDAWFAWALRLSSGGFLNFYSDNIWTNYTPGFLYILKFLGDLQHLFSINNELFYFILKIPAIIADLIIAFLSYKIIIKKNSLKTARLAVAAFILNPVIIFNSAVWGQIDSILTIFLVLSVYFLESKKLFLSSISYGLALLVKPQAILLLPIFLFFLSKNFSFKNLIKLTFPGVIILFALAAPFFGFTIFQKLPELFLKMSGDYPYNSLFAYNFWGVMGFWIKDNQMFGFLSFQQWGYLLFFAFWIFITFWYFRKNKFSLYSLATLAALSFYFLPTRVHDRYLYPAIPFLIIICFKYRSRLLLLLTTLISFIHLLNLYYVYIYYNYFFLKLPSDIYNSFIYNFMDKFGKQLSLLSTFLFILVTIWIIRSNHVKKNL